MFSEVKRERFLAPDELPRIWRAIQEEVETIKNIPRFLGNPWVFPSNSGLSMVAG
jgi:hypothetical protein